MTKDVAKYLRFACGTDPIPKWERLLDKDMLLAYMQKLERHGVGLDGQTQKLDTLDAAVRYYREEILEDDPGNVVYGKAMRIADKLKVWRASLRKKRSKLQAARLEKQSAKKHHVTLEEVDKMFSSKQMWEDFAGVVDSLQKGLPVKNQELNLCTTIIAALLIFRSWQRSGAAINATLDEYKERSKVRVGGEATVVIKVAEHKTGATASAKIILKHADLARLNSYVTVVRKVLDLEGRSPYLLCSPGGKKMSKFRHEILSKRYGFERVTSTQVRVSGATEAARKLPDKDQRLVTKQLSHTRVTSTKYYEAIAGPSHAAKAFCSMQQLHRPSGSSSSDSDEGSHVKHIVHRKKAPPFY